MFVAVAFALFSITACAAQSGKTFPFTQAENQDGSKFVWFIFGNVGSSYDYVPAKDLPKSPHFGEVAEPQPGDVAWWPGFVAIVKLHNGQLYSYITAESERAPGDVEILYGKPHFFRYIVFEPSK
ncbi:MAG: hypothetical protein WDM70_00450 [Nitrosomonadales bacterium]